MTTVATQRAEAAQRLRTQARKLIEQQGVNRQTLVQILGELKTLAAQRAFWTEQNYPAPDASELQARYLVAVGNDHTYALYLNVMRPGKRVPPHNHTTWACIAAVDGEEQNCLYERLDGGTAPGVATISQTEHVAVGPATGIALLPDDIHSVEITGNAVIRHLHLYGRALETLNERLVFDQERGTSKIMDLGVKTRSASPDPANG